MMLPNNLENEQFFVLYIFEFLSDFIIKFMKKDNVYYIITKTYKINYQSF